MYGFVTHTWNTIKGKCPHDCEYCYMKRFPQKPVRFDEIELNTDLGEGNFIFVGSSCDMWAEGIFGNWIFVTLKHCNKFKNKYLFQSKNPDRFDAWFGILPKDSILATTIESNMADCYNAAPVWDRIKYIRIAKEKGYVSVEDICVALNWSQDRVLKTLQSLEESGIAKFRESLLKGKQWYFPSI